MGNKHTSKLQQQQGQPNRQLNKTDMLGGIGHKLTERDQANTVAQQQQAMDAISKPARIPRAPSGE